MAGTSLEELQHPERLKLPLLQQTIYFILLTSQEEDEATEVTPWVPHERGVERRCHSQRSSSLTAFGRAAHHVHSLIGIPMPFSPPHVDASQVLLDLSFTTSL